ncbi:hypothetical protein, conserved [Eimeria brunetti]|uniref:Uncharacterized protein n=1 Tax=Eimeria brunetti TaxID=51314 RepID=U6LPR8_9EIME|nr:hypothetical protein, conserved [Eimeria brunetti]
MLDASPLWGKDGGGDLHEVSLSRPAGPEKKVQENANRPLLRLPQTSPKSVSITVGVAAFAAVVATIFLLSHCIILFRKKTNIGSGSRRRLAGNGKTKFGDFRESFSGRLCESPLFEGPSDPSSSTSPAIAPRPSEPKADGEKRKNTACYTLQRKRERGEGSSGLFVEEADGYGMGLQKKRREARDLQPSSVDRHPLSRQPLERSESGSTSLEPDASMDRYIEEALAAGEAGLSFDAWLLDPEGEMPTSPSRADLDPAFDGSSTDTAEEGSILDPASPPSLECGVSGSATQQPQHLGRNWGSPDSAFPPLDRNTRREAPYVLPPRVQQQPHLDGGQPPASSLDHYIDEALAVADNSPLDLDQWLLDSDLSPDLPEFQVSEDDSPGKANGQHSPLNGDSPLSLKVGISLEVTEAAELWEKSKHLSGPPPPPFTTELFPEAWGPRQPGRHLPSPQVATNHQHSQLKQNNQQHGFLASHSQMEGQGGEHDLLHHMPNVQTPAGKDINFHPFFRIPTVVPGAVARGFKKANLAAVNSKNFDCLRSLLAVKDCLKLPVLNWEELDTLITHAELLVGYALLQMKARVERVKPTVAVERLAFALILVDSLYAASQVWGPQSRRNEWWGRVIHALPVYSGPKRKPRYDRATGWRVQLAQSIHTALNVYRRGGRPPAPVLVSLKRDIFCTKKVPRFRRGRWLQWSIDDAEWQVSP